MEQLLVRISDTELGQFYMKYREAQAGVVARAFPPSKRSVKLPLAKVVAKIEPGLFFYVELTRHDSGERLCVVHVDAQSYQNDLAAHLAWEPEAVEFIDGFLQWLTSNFRTDAPQPLTSEERDQLEKLKEWEGSGKFKRELAQDMCLSERQLARVAERLAEKGYVTEFYLADRNKSGNVR